MPVLTRGDVERYVFTVTANGTSTVTVAAPMVTANSIINMTLKTVGGTPAPLVITTITPGTGYTFVSSTGNTSVYNALVL